MAENVKKVLDTLMHVHYTLFNPFGRREARPLKAKYGSIERAWEVLSLLGVSIPPLRGIQECLISDLLELEVIDPEIIGMVKKIRRNMSGAIPELLGPAAELDDIRRLIMFYDTLPDLMSSPLPEGWDRSIAQKALCELEELLETRQTA